VLVNLAPHQLDLDEDAYLVELYRRIRAEGTLQRALLPCFSDLGHPVG
jgi:hypothetical protein